MAAQTLLNNEIVLDQLADEIRNFYTLEVQTNAASTTKMMKCDVVCVTGAAVAVVGLAIASAPALAAAEAVYDALNAKTERLLSKLENVLVKAYDTAGTEWMAETYKTSLEPYIRLYTKQQEHDGKISLREKEKLHLSIKLNYAPFISEGNREEYPIVGQLLDGISKLQDC